MRAPTVLFATVVIGIPLAQAGGCISLNAFNTCTESVASILPCTTEPGLSACECSSFTSLDGCFSSYCIQPNGPANPYSLAIVNCGRTPATNGAASATAAASTPATVAAGATTTAVPATTGATTTTLGTATAASTSKGGADMLAVQVGGMLAAALGVLAYL